MKEKAFPLIALSILSVVSAQLMLKYGLNGASNTGNIIQFFIGLLFNPYVLIGVSLFVLSAALWLMVLTKAELSYAYPALSLGYVFTAIGAWVLFQEDLNMIRAIGIIIVCAGVFTLSRS